MEDHQGAVKKIFSTFLPVQSVFLFVDSDGDGLNECVDHICERCDNLENLLIDSSHSNLPLSGEHLKVWAQELFEHYLLNASRSEMVKVDLEV